MTGRPASDPWTLEALKRDTAISRSIINITSVALTLFPIIIPRSISYYSELYRPPVSVAGYHVIETI